MTQSPRIPRTLWYESNTGRKTFAQSDLLNRSEPIVILGEPGMGKTELLRWLGQQPGYTFCTARQLYNVRPSPQKLLGDASVLVIDALDELSVREEGDAVDTVLQKLGDAGYPKFVLACRVSDWRSATGRIAIAEQYTDALPLILHLEPLTEKNIHQILVAELDGDDERAHDIVKHFDRLGLNGLLSNPQTLELVSRVASNGRLPETKVLLFEEAVNLLRRETNDARVALQLDEETALDAAEAAFATLILTGSEALVVNSPEANEAELLLVEVAALPGAAKLKAVIGSRLFGTAGSSNRFSYWHRRIGEYLGARWLARQSSSSMRQRRILSLFHANGLVPSSLRGLHAWLAHHSTSLAPEVIDADVTAFIDYGESDSINVTQARLILDALKKLARRNPNFYLDGDASAKGLVQPELLEDIRGLIQDHTTAHYLLYLILKNVKGSVIAHSLAGELHSLILDSAVDFYLRKLAVDVLVHLNKGTWTVSLEELRCLPPSTDNLRLTLEIIEDLGVNYFGARSVIEFLLSHSDNEERTLGLFGKFGRDVSDDCVDSLLDELVRQIQAAEENTSNRRVMTGELADFSAHLISRRLDVRAIDPRKLWSWLKEIDLRHAYDRSVLDDICSKLQNARDLRLAIQRLVLLEEGGAPHIRQRLYQLERACAGLVANEDDALALLATLDPANRTDQRWRKLLLLIEHSTTKGVRLRNAVKAFALHRPDLLTWIKRHGVQRVTKREIKRSRTTLLNKLRKKLAAEENCSIYRANIDALRQGKFPLAHDPALVFLGAASNVAKEGPPRERLSAWLDDDLAEAAIQGFEAYLESEGPPTAHQLGQSNAESKSWNTGCIIVAAALARFLEDRTFDGVSDDRLRAAYWLSLRFDDISLRAEFRSALLEELRIRKQLDIAVQQWIEPQLQLRRSNVNDLHEVLWSVLSEPSAKQLGLSWLSQFSDLPVEPEAEIIDRLLSLSVTGELQYLAAQRLSQSLPAERRLSWEAVAFLTSPDAHQEQFCQAGPEISELIWWLRRRVRNDRKLKVAFPLSVEQMACLISRFRYLHPFAPRPEGVTTGDTNPWDATRFIEWTAERLAQVTTTTSVNALATIANAPVDGYTPHLLGLVAEQRRNLAEQQYRPATLNELSAIANARPPTTVTDLQSTVLELLNGVQKRIAGDNVDSWKNFYFAENDPFGEERCRDQILLMLGVRPESIDFDPEIHSADNKRADIGASFKGMRLPIEIKGQWHKELWTAADRQLDRLYAIDHAADRRGIYLVLWFGNSVPFAKLARARDGHTRPQSAEELRLDLERTSRAAREGRISIVVLDLERRQKQMNRCEDVSQPT